MNSIEKHNPYDIYILFIFNKLVKLIIKSFLMKIRSNY